MKETALILGAASSIARAAASAFAARGHDLYLAGRDMEELERIASDIRIRHGVDVRCGFFDAEDCDSHEAFLKRVCEEAGELGGVLLAFGHLGEQRPGASAAKEGALTVARNFLGAVSVLELCAAMFEERRAGFIIGISSVAGDRGRQSNYLYGAAKGGLSLYLQGLRNRLFPAGVRVLTVKPGFVDTAMTFGRPGLFLVASPERVGSAIVRALEGGRDVVYVPWFWRYIMLVIKLIPEPIFKRLKL